MISKGEGHAHPKGLIDALIYKKKPATMEDKSQSRLQIQVVSMTQLYIADNVVIHLLSKTSLMVMWTKLKDMHMTKLLTNALFLWKQFYQLQISKGQSIQEYLSNLQRILTNLLSDGEKVEKTKVLDLLSSLLSSFESLVTTLLLERSIIKMEEVMQHYSRTKF